MIFGATSTLLRVSLHPLMHGPVLFTLYFLQSKLQDVQNAEKTELV